jgi:hypothetical protein
MVGGKKTYRKTSAYQPFFYKEKRILIINILLEHQDKFLKKYTKINIFNSYLIPFTHRKRTIVHECVFLKLTLPPTTVGQLIFFLNALFHVFDTFSYIFSKIYLGVQVKC